MKLGLSTGYWSAGPPAGVQDSIAEAERLGFDSVWVHDHVIMPSGVTSRYP